MKGELCASAGIGEQPTSNAARARQGSVERIDAKCMAASLRLAHAACARGHTRRGLPAPRLDLLALGRQFRVAGEIADRGQREAVHRDGSLLPSVGPGGSPVSLFTRPMIGIAIRRVFVQKCGTGCAGVARSGPCSCMVAARDSQEGVAAMSLAHTRSDATVEECLDELNDIIMGLQSYPPTGLAGARGVELATLA